MALTNYGGTVGSGVWFSSTVSAFGLGVGIGLTGTESIAFYVFLVQMAFSVLWLSYFRFGPLEWGWRMLTYGKWLKIRK